VVLTPYNDKWLITLVTHQATLLKMRIWCWDTFGEGWGEFSNTREFPNTITLPTPVFVFHRLSHANWFLLKWSEMV
jgi:hypothetical protein